MKLTLFLVLINIALFFLTLTDPHYFVTTFGFSMRSFLAGNYYNLITSMFIHDPSTIWHLANNMIALFLLGYAVEQKVRAWQYLLVYFSAGVLGILLLYVPVFGYSSDTMVIGASAAISGLIGLGTFVCPGKFVFYPIVIPIPFVVAGALFFISTTSLLFAASDIAYPAHLGGLIAGALFGLKWGEHRYRSIMIFILTVLFIIALPYVLEFVFA